MNVLTDCGQLILESDSAETREEIEGGENIKESEGCSLGYLGDAYKELHCYEEAIEAYKQSIAIAQSIGNRRTEGISRGNVGDLLYKTNRYEEAKEELQKAISLCDVTIPAASGAFRGSLARILVRENNMDAALLLIKKGELQVQSYAEEYGKFLCKKALIEKIAQRLKQAKKTLDQAKQMASELKISDESEFGKLLVVTTKSIDKISPCD